MTTRSQTNRREMEVVKFYRVETAGAERVLPPGELGVKFYPDATPAAVFTAATATCSQRGLTRLFHVLLRVAAF